MSGNVIRPVWEDDASRAAEESIAKAVAEVFITGYEKMWKAHGLDFAFTFTGRTRFTPILFFGECKERWLTFGYSDGYYISLLKARAAAETMRVTGLPCFAFCRFKDRGIRYAPFQSSYKRTIWAGRDDRPHDPNAKEPHVVIDWSRFADL